ncbi:unnamed protein product [Nyctereutes procyonoides]|uniref:(raccoon dog) hypothetical protein n=1 Tax=Nyctereutes procyonoides TaxID=34880 RepID=A0A811YW83_NYCPR|nr:unnamed protein product [Nyctereutes procyonoides]
MEEKLRHLLNFLISLLCLVNYLMGCLLMFLAVPTNTKISI